MIERFLRGCITTKLTMSELFICLVIEQRDELKTDYKKKVELNKQLLAYTHELEVLSSETLIKSTL